MEQRFLLGAATAAHQVEGNNIHSDFWIMEQLPHSSFVEPSMDAVDHYNRYEEDIRLLSDAGLNAYRFSIEWARIEPEEGKFDEKELAHYRDVVRCCYENNVTPVVTMMHFSSPAWLIGKGGWAKPYVADAFARYCEYVVENIGEELPYICTINEANMGLQLKKISERYMQLRETAKEGDVQVGVNFDMENIKLNMMEQAQAFQCDPREINTFLSGRSEEQERYVMEAHKAAKAAIKLVCPDAKVGLTLSLYDIQALPGGEKEAEKLWQEDFGIYLPYIIEDDFLGVQNYTRKVIGPEGQVEPETERPRTQMDYENYPWSIGRLLRRVAEEFPGELLVTENGISIGDDSVRCDFIREAVGSVMEAKKDGVPVFGYCYWSLLDNFEWHAGYGKTFGLIAVDRKTQTRFPKESLKVLGGLISGSKD